MPANLNHLNVRMPEQEENTLMAQAMSRVHTDVLSGALQPGSRLVLADLAGRYNVGLTPMREALSRLVAHGLVIASGQRGFSVAPTSHDDLVDITRMRVAVEKDAFARAILHGDDSWEAGIVAALHLMRVNIDRAGANFNAQSPGFDAAHKSFHTALLAGCGSPRMLAAHASLYDQAYRYRLIRMSGLSSDVPNFLGEHESLANLALRRQRDEAVARLVLHLESTLTHVYPTGPDVPQ